MSIQWRILKFAERFNHWVIETAGGDERPAFHDIDDVCPQLHRLEEAWPRIRAEVVDLMNDLDRVPTLNEVKGDDACLSAKTPHDWRQFWLLAFGERAEANCARCPETVRLLERIPGVRMAHFSLLDAGKTVAAHSGNYAGLLRYHLGVIVPTKNPPQFRVHDQMYTWREGEAMIFDDTHEHEVFNSCAEPRVVLVVDVDRPMSVPQQVVSRLTSKIAHRIFAKPQIERVRQFSNG